MNPHPAFDGKHVVITGAASGIGRAAAIAAADRGAIVHLTDRNADLLEDTAETIRRSEGVPSTYARSTRYAASPSRFTNRRSRPTS
jgi:NAD(P)-dependent dehydrogenase (short-subunit alcohol dehydrogenase family)